MSKRITRKDTWDVIRVINRRLGKHGYTHRVGLELHTTKASMVMFDENDTIATFISPQLSGARLHEWVTAYWKGLSLGLMEPEGIDPALAEIR